METPNYYEIIKTSIELHVKYKLDLQRKDMWCYATKLAMEVATDPAQQEEIGMIFRNLDINPSNFAMDLYKVINRCEHKVNCLRLVGVPNSCKTLIANCIAAPFITCYANNHGSENEFYLSNFLNKSLILCEELYVTIATAEDFKSVLGGQPIDIAKKFNEKQLLCRTPVIITSNYSRFGRGHLSPVDEHALALRCRTFYFGKAYKPKIQIDWQQFYLFMAIALANHSDFDV